MREVSFKIRNFFRKINKKKLVISLFLTALVFSVSFLTLGLVKYYQNSVINQDNAKLFYTFKPHTLRKYNTSLINDSDLQEKFLSYNISYGIDVSEWQDHIDWKQVASTGISFAMIRCGFREIDGSNVKEDGRFRENIVGAREAGLNVGVYFFGTARNQEEAIEEAEFTVNLIKDYDINYPVVYDAEVINRGRLEGVDYSTLTDNILAYTDTIESYGYASMVYSYSSALTYYYDTGRLDGKLIWLAYYGDHADYNGNFNMWQYADNGRVAGINAYVDLNISYFTYVDNEDEIVANPDYRSAPATEFTSVNDEIRVKADTVLRSSPTTSIPNKIKTLPGGTILKIKGLSNDFSNILYNGIVINISNKKIS